MATTQLQLGAWGGKRYGSFAGRAEVTQVYGGRFVAGHVFLSGIQRATVAKTGFAEGAVHNPGFQHAGATR
jgi:hypothetical protein